MPVYRYKLRDPSGISVASLSTQLPDVPTAVGPGSPEVFLDVDVAATSKLDLDAVLDSLGYLFVEEAPSTTPQEAAQDGFLNTELTSLGFGTGPDAVIKYDAINGLVGMSGIASVMWRFLQPMQSKSYGVPGYTKSRYDLRGGAGTTVGNASTVLRSIVLDDKTTYWFDARVCARDSGGVLHAAFGRRVMASREVGGGGAALSVVDNYWTVDPSLTLAVTWVLSGAQAQLRVTGSPGLTLEWVATIEHQLVSTSA